MPDDESQPNGQADAERQLSPTIDVPDESDASPELRRRFWWLVVVFNVALGALALGAMVVAFRGQFETGGSLIAAGGVLAAYGYYKYRDYRYRDYT